MQEAKPAEAIYTDAQTGEEIPCLVTNSNVLISGMRYMGIRIGEEERTVPARDIKLLS